MGYAYQAELPNMKQGTFSKLTAEVNINKLEDTKNELHIEGYLIFRRELKENKKNIRITVIKDSFPLDVVIKKHRLINENDGVSIYINNFDFEIEDEVTKVTIEFRLTNIKDGLIKTNFLK